MEHGEPHADAALGAKLANTHMLTSGLEKRFIMGLSCVAAWSQPVGTSYVRFVGVKVNLPRAILAS